ncbi:MAG TPA: c-type cytochrome [Xanthomonadales bacterium]|nr:c-type cytochrome [Xanthomonadales bacterium]
MRIVLPVALVALLAAGALAAQEPAAQGARAEPTPAPSASDQGAAATPTPVTDTSTTPATSATPSDALPVGTATNETQPPAAADAGALAVAKPGDPAAGEAKAAACGACHGLDGNSADPQYPKLAGQNERYIARQLKLFKSGQRQNPIMQPFAAALSPQDMRDLGAFFATKSVMAGTGDEAFKEHGQALFRGGNGPAALPACMACHGPTGRGNPGAAYPAIGGQHADYTKGKLMAFRDGLVLGTGDDANSIMATVAANLSDEDIDALASYVEGLHEVSAGEAAEPGAQNVAAQPEAAPGAPGTVAPSQEPSSGPEKVPAPPAATPAPAASQTPSG